MVLEGHNSSFHSPASSLSCVDWLYLLLATDACTKTTTEHPDRVFLQLYGARWRRPNVGTLKITTLPRRHNIIYNETHRGVYCCGLTSVSNRLHNTRYLIYTLRIRVAGRRRKRRVRLEMANDWCGQHTELMKNTHWYWLISNTDHHLSYSCGLALRIYSFVSNDEPR